MKTVTLLFLRDLEQDRILLAVKKRGFGAGKLNGVGGKVEPGETIPQAAVREAREEIGVTISETDAQQIGRLRFAFAEHPDWAFDCHVFIATAWDGTPQETEEMAPAWHAIEAIPFDRMWIDDKHWLPRALAGEYVDGAFSFGGDGEFLLDHAVNGAACVHAQP